MRRVLGVLGVLEVLGGLTVLVVLAVLGGSLTAQQTAPAAPNPIVGPPLVPLAESYLRWPLPASAAAYGRIDGSHLKQFVASKLRSFGMDVRLEETALPPAWFPTSWAVSAANGARTVALNTAHPV